MKALLLTLEFPPFKGGVSNYYENLVKYWPKEGQISVLDNNDNSLVKGLLWPRWLPAYRALNKKVKKELPDHLIVGHILPLGTVAYMYYKKHALPYTVILHGMDIAFAQKSKRKLLLAKKILHHAQNIICANHHTAEITSKLVSSNNQNKIKIVNPGVDTALKENTYLETKILNKYNLENKIVLFSLGRLVKRKGFDRVIEALPQVWKVIPDLVYYIAGTGPDEKYLKDLAARYSGIGFLGEIDDGEKWAWYHTCDLFVMPARDRAGDFEGFGIVYLEANLAGKPVIAGNAGGVADAVENNLNGLIVEPENKEHIANAIIELANNKKLREKMGENGHARVLRAFNWKNQVGYIYNILFKN